MAGASPTAARSSWPGAFGCGSRSWILESAERDRSLNLLGKGAALTLAFRFTRARGRPLGQRFRSRATRSYGVGFGASRSKPLAEGLMGVCALWHFRLGDRALDPWACGRRTARGEFLVAGAGRRRGRRRFAFLDFEIGGGGRFANRRSQQLAFGCGPRSLELAERDCSLNLLRKGGRVNIRSSFHARARAAPRPAVSIGGRRGAMG